MKKILLLTLTLFTLLFSGCNETPQGEQWELYQGEPLLGSEPVTITFWHCASEEAGLLLDEYISSFNQENPYNITVEAVYQGQYADATTLLKTLLSAENYQELPNIMQMDATGKVVYHDSGMAYTIDRALAEYPDTELLSRYQAAALGNWQYAGTQLGLPFATSTTITYYNADLLAEAGWDEAPLTFSQVAQVYQDMQAAGLSQKALQNIPNSPSLSNWLGQLDSYVVDMSNGSEGLASELVCLENGALEAFLLEWKNLYQSGALSNQESSTDAFIAGDVALLSASSSSLASILEKVDGSFTLGVSPYLKVNEYAADGAAVSGSCLVMFQAEQLEKEAAWYFLQYLTSAEIQADFAANTGYIPSHIQAVDEPVYQQVLTEYPQYQVVLQQLENTPADFRSITVGPATDFYYTVMQGCSDMLEYDMSPEDTAAWLDEELSLLLETYWRNNQ